MKRHIFRTLSLALCLALCLGLCPVAQAAEVDGGTFGEDNSLSWSLNDAGELRISGTGSMPDYSNYNGTPWYVHREEITSVVIGEGITRVGNRSFENYWKLAGLTLPEGLTEIGYCAFGDCAALQELVIPGTVRSMDVGAFANCCALISLTIRDGVTGLGTTNFQGCRELTSVTIPGSVKTIGDAAFCACTKLERVELPEGLETIGEGAFSKCPALTQITLPSTLAYLGPVAFQQTGLTHVTIPAGMDSGSSPFYKSALETVTIQPGRTAIPQGMFYGCASLKAVVIPEGVTTIGNGAFQECTALTSVTIPSTVTVIEGQAFNKCSSLTEIDLPRHLDDLGFFVFKGCSSLKRVVVPEGVTEMQGTFQDCYALEQVTLPQSLTDLQGGDFKNTALKELVIPPHVTRIGRDCFYNCAKLEKINLPEGVTKIGYRAFESCSSLTEITLPSTLREMEGRVFAGTGLSRINLPVSLEKAFGTYNGKYSDSSFGMSGIHTFVFDEGREVIQAELLKYAQPFNITIPASVTTIEQGLQGWGYDRSNIFFLGTKEQWEAIPGHEAENVGTERVFFGDEPAVQSIPNDHYLVRVVDQEGKPYAGITIEGGELRYLTGEDGRASVILGEGRVLPPLTFYRDGYRAFSLGGRTLKESETGETVAITRYEKTVTPAEIRPEAAYCQFSTHPDMAGAVDITTRNQMVNVNTAGTIYLRVGVSQEDKVERVALWNYYSEVAELIPGQIAAVPVSELKVGGSYTLRVWDKEGRHTSRSINLIPTEEQFEDIPDLDLSFDEVKIPVGEGVPFLGDSELKLELPFQLPMTLQYDGESNTYRAGINLKDGFTDENFQDIKKCISGLERLGSVVRRCDLGELKRLAGEAIDGALMDDDNQPLKITVAGYLEAQGNGKGSLEVLRGRLAIGLELKGKLGFDTVVWVVPVTVQVELGLEAQAIGTLTYRLPTHTVSGTLDIVIKPSLEAFGGVGHSKLAGVGAYGKAELEVAARLLGSPQGLQRVALTGELGIKAYVGPLEYSKGFVSNTWQLYPKETAAQEAALFDLYDAGAYRRQDLRYLAEESPWQESAQATLFAAAPGTNLQTLLSNTYRNAQPALAATDDALYAAFLRADEETNDVYTAVSKYDGSVWSEPVRCDAAAVLDGAPSLAVDADGTVWLAFTQTEADFEVDSLLSYAQKQSLVVGTVDPDTCAFTELKRYQGTGHLRLAQLELAGGGPVLAWADSYVTDDDSVLWPAASELYTAVYTNGAWGEAREAAQVSKPVTDLAVGERSGALAVAYVADEDGDSATQTDRSLYLDADETPVAQNVQGRVSFAALPGAGADFVWDGADGLYTAGGLAIPAAGITGEYALTADRLYYSAAAGGAANLTAVTYAGGAWSVPVKLTGGERYLENLDVAQMGGKDYLLGMYTNAAVTEERYGVWVEDAKDLIWASVEPVSDLQLEVGRIEGDMTPGEYAQVPVTVYNAGDHDVTALQFTCSGARLSDSYIVCSPALAPGQSWTGTVGIRCPEQYASYTLSVCEDGQVDFTPEDSAAIVELGMADLAVELTEQRVEGNSTLVAVIRNEGIGQATARGQFVNGQGEVLGGFVVTDLAPGAAATASCESVEASGDYTVRLMCLDPDRYSYNDSATLYVDQPSRILSVAPSGGKVAVELNAQAAGSVWCALYDDGGKLLAATSQTVEAGRQSVELGVSLPTTQAAVVKAFLLDEKAGPQCGAMSWEKS